MSNHLKIALECIVGITFIAIFPTSVPVCMGMLPFPTVSPIQVSINEDTKVECYYTNTYCFFVADDVLPSIQYNIKVQQQISKYQLLCSTQQKNDD